jgi:DNA replication and repair protein RecF
MQLRSLQLRNFRSHPDLLIEFESGVSLIFGPNAIGKTTILEAIHLLMMGRSFRTFQIAELIGRRGTGFQVEAVFTKHNVEQKLSVSFDGTERKIEHNETQFRRLSNILGIIQGVAMTPDDATLVKGGPDLRRRYLDFQLSQTDPLYLEHLSRYGRAMRQRNLLLKMNDTTTIDGWEEEMANAASYIARQRYLAVDDLQGLAQKIFCVFSGDDKQIAIAYETRAPFESEKVIRDFYLQKYKELRPREMDVGSTLTGPHRDDLIISLDKMDARHFASEGQQRMCVAALKFAEWERMRHQSNIFPLMLIDDVGVSLDESRRDKLFSHISTLGQVVLTATDNKVHYNHSIDLTQVASPAWV